MPRGPIPRRLSSPSPGLVLVDLDNTLVDQHAAFRVWATEFAAVHHLDAGAVIAREPIGSKGPFFEQLHARHHLPGTPEDLWQQYRTRMPALVTCPETVKSALRRLRAAGHRLGIVTNGKTDNQTAKIWRTGLADLVDAWCVSEEAGVRKPSRAIFAMCASRCGTDLDDGGWMIGDNPIDDIAGGRSAGLRTAWVRTPAQTWPDNLPTPDLTVTSVAEAADALLGQG